MAELSKEHVEHLSRLIRIELSQEEQARFASQLSSIVKYVDALSEVDTSGLTKLGGVTGLHNVAAPDEVRSADDQCSVPKADLLTGAPATDGSFIEVRAVLGNDGGS